MESINPFSIIWKALIMLFTKVHFSWINFINFANIVVQLLPIWISTGVIPLGWSFIITSVLSLIIKLGQRHKELVSTGISLDPVFYLFSLLGIIMGSLDQFIASGSIYEHLGKFWAGVIVILYSFVLIVLRTGFTNQSANTIAKRKIMSK